jgi:hypothetical protein
MEVKIKGRGRFKKKKKPYMTLKINMPNVVEEYSSIQLSS